MSTCVHCRQPTHLDLDLAVPVCAACGSLVDPSLSVLTSTQPDPSPPWRPSTLKALRSRSNWDLPGQGKESRDRKNAYAMAQFIKSLAASFNASALSPRATTLFNQVKTASPFRWGTKARAVAAACFAIALRESNRADSLRDIAALLNVPPTSVSREFTSITSALNLSLPLLDPSVLLPTLQTHLVSVLNDNNTKLPPALSSSLRLICLRSAANTATALGELLARLSPDHHVLCLPVAPTACALFILGLEAHNRTLLNPLGELAQSLGSCCHAKKSVVMTRYKILQDQVASWVEKVSWLDKYESKKGRATVSKRLVVARGLKDLIQVQEQIWQRKIKPSLELDGDHESKESDDEPSHPSVPQKHNRGMAKAAQFLANPLTTNISSTLPYLPLAAYILANPSVSLRRPPTRLQLLALNRGGADERHIPDDDLFAPGELENILRAEEEVHVLRETFGWDKDDETDNLKRKPIKSTKKRLTHDVGELNRPNKKSRINLVALAKFMADGDDTSTIEEEGIDSSMWGLEAINDSDQDMNHMDNEDETLEPISTSLSGHSSKKAQVSERNETEAADELIVDNWRPPTPERANPSSRYEEEHD